MFYSEYEALGRVYMQLSHSLKTELAWGLHAKEITRGQQGWWPNSYNFFFWFWGLNPEPCANGLPLSSIPDLSL